jgi:hypothetical protein
VKPVSNRTQYALVSVGYAGVLAVSTALLYRRHLLELQDPATASGGMFAAGDTMLHIFMGCLFLVPTAFLIRIMARSEALYSAYSRFLLGLSLSAPVCFAVALFADKYVPQSLSWFCSFRVEESPIIFLGIGISRVAARFDRARRLASYALLVEGLSLCLPIAAFVVAIFIHR